MDSHTVELLPFDHSSMTLTSWRECRTGTLSSSRCSAEVSIPVHQSMGDKSALRDG